MNHDQVGDPTYTQAVEELLGALAYAELSGYLRVAADAQSAPTLSLQITLGSISARAWQNFYNLNAHISQAGADIDALMQPFVRAVDQFHERTPSKDWLEGLVKAYVGDEIARDFYREVARRVDPATRAVVDAVLDDRGQSQALADLLRRAIEENPTSAGRLALWGRRLVGEAIAQTQHVAADHDALAALLIGAWEQEDEQADLVELGRMLTRLTEAHTARMRRVGLAS